ncbi:hypothetical protein DSECCO2_633400 [anaerobic digester metagenome]
MTPSVGVSARWTVTWAVPDTQPLVAPTVAVPVFRAEKYPVAFTVPTASSLLVQVNSAPGISVPSLSDSTAVNCRPSPAVRDTLSGVTVTMRLLGLTMG